MPCRSGNLVDEVMQLFDSGIGRLGFCEKIGQIADERVDGSGARPDQPGV